MFAHWRERPVAPLVAALGFADEGVAVTVTFEEPLPTGLPGDPPFADVALRWPDGSVVSVESKFTEWLVRRPHNKRVFKDKYFPAAVGGGR